jgi:NAD(P)-dependent dehydrogenase (short-subunit alcohol dehydrogenase family)
MSAARSRNAKSRETIAVVAGVGSCKGLGAALARRFAREGLLVLVAGRTEQRLENVAAEIIAARGKAVAVATDVTSEKDVIRLFSLAEERGRLDLVVYNAGGNATSSLLQLKRSEFESLWKQSALGGFLVGREAVRRMLPQRQGTLIFTGATASIRARPPFAAFASAKAALRAVAQGFAREFGPHGIHVAHAIIDGVIRGDYAQTKFAELARSKGEDGLIEPDAIADAYWALHRQSKTAWTHELDLRPFKEPF